MHKCFKIINENESTIDVLNRISLKKLNHLKRNISLDLDPNEIDLKSLKKDKKISYQSRRNTSIGLMVLKNLKAFSVFNYL